MTDFNSFIVLILGICFTITSIICLSKDFSCKDATKWWRWLLDPLGLFVGIGFICEYCFLH